MTQNPEAASASVRDVPPKHDIAVESVDNQRVAIHLILRKEYGDKGEFNETRSWCSFRRAMQNHIIKNVIGKDGKYDAIVDSTRLYHQRFRVFFPDDWMFEYDIHARMAGTGIVPNEYDALPVHYHSSVYNFYEAIGYDRTRRKLQSWKRRSI